MTDIKQGDWVTVGGDGPYVVDSVHRRWLYLTVDACRAYVLAGWCVKADPPWKPGPGTVWQGSTGVVVRVARNAAEVQVMGSIATYTVQDIHTAERPLVELVPKDVEAPVRTYDDEDVDQLCDRYYEGFDYSYRVQASGDTDKAHRAGVVAVLKEVGLL